MLSLQESSIPLGSLFGIPVRLHVLFPVVLVLQVLIAGLPRGKWDALLMFVIFGPVLLLTVFVHELGQCFAARKVGSQVHSILLWPLGGLAYIGHTSTPKADLLVSLAGPLTHIPQIALWLILGLSLAAAADDESFKLSYPSDDKLEDHFGLALSEQAINVNIALFIFNLLIPAYPLDGGRILVDTLLMAGMELETTAKVSIGVSALIVAALAIWAIATLKLFLLLIAVWIGWAVYGVFDAYKKGVIRQHPMFSFDDGAEQALPYAPQGPPAASGGQWPGPANAGQWPGPAKV